MIFRFLPQNCIFVVIYFELSTKNRWHFLNKISISLPRKNTKKNNIFTYMKFTRFLQWTYINYLNFVTVFEFNKHIMYVDFDLNSYVWENNINIFISFSYLKIFHSKIFPFKHTQQCYTWEQWDSPLRWLCYSIDGNNTFLLRCKIIVIIVINTMIFC